MRKLLFFITILLIGCTIKAQESLVAYYPFNGNANDESGNEQNGTVFGATLAAGRLGNADSCYYFDGDDYIRIDESSSFNVKTSGFTFSVWAKPDTNQNVTWANIASFGGTRQGGYGVLYIEPWNSLSVVDLYSNSSNSSRITIDSDHLNPRVWSMYTFTYKDGIYKVYFNGVPLDQTSATVYASTGNDFIIGASRTISDNFKGWIDEVRIYNRALTDIEVANLSGLSGAVRATELDAYALTDFELGALEPVKYSDYWAIWGGAGTGYTKAVENPIKSGANTSNYCGAAITFPSTTDRASKTEYVLTTEDGLLDDHHHIMQWKQLFADSTILQLDNIVWDWMSINQIHGGCQLYDGGECEYGGSIAYGGGIFNDCGKAHSIDPSIYRFRYRAMPDSAMVPFRLDIGEWMSFTYEIFWTHSDTGYWRVWKDGELLGSADDVKTLPDCCGEGSNFLQFKTGLYNVWTDSESDSLVMHIDDLELFIGEDKSVEEICPECDVTNLNTDVKIRNKNTRQVKIFPNPVKNNLTIQGERVPSSVTIYSIEGRKIIYVENSNVINLSHLSKGIYLVTIKMKDSLLRKKFIKE